MSQSSGYALIALIGVIAAHQQVDYRTNGIIAVKKKKQISQRKVKSSSCDAASKGDVI